MNKDYKPRSKQTNNGYPFLSGLMIGFLFGVIITAALTIYIKGDASPFQDTKSKPYKAEASKSLKPESTLKSKQPEDRLDFYTILPKTNIPETKTEVVEKEITPIDKKVKIKTKKENYFLQVGSFKAEADADNLKAKLALQGFEATVQTITIPEQGEWHRVRVGPLNNIDSINKIRTDLLANSFNADLIKVQSEIK